MTREKLQSLLDAGSITQEEFDELVKNIKEPETEPEAEEETEVETEPKKDADDILQRRKQAEIDKAMAKERKEKAELKRKLERLEKKILTDEEQKQADFERQQQEIEEQRRELQLEKNKMYAVKSMKKAEISDSEEAMLLMEKLVASCEDETEIDDMITLLKAWKDKDVSTEVAKRFKENGYTPKKSSELNGGVNPFSKEGWNFTEQMRLYNDDPELAKKLEAAAKQS